jgi:predicted DNA-binding protein YlxM (UPF0122 family)
LFFDQNVTNVHNLIFKKGLTARAECGILCKGFCFTGGESMFEKNLSLSFLLDQYGSVLGERHRMMLELYYNQDLSLAEIAAEVGISRQGVRDSIKKAEEELRFLEQNLHLHEKAMAVAKAGETLLAMPLSNEARTAVQALLTAAGVTLPQ